MDVRSHPQSSRPPTRRRRRWLHVITAVVIVIAAAVAVLPFGLAYGLQRWLLARGADQVEIGNVDFNPFTGTLAIRELLVRDGNDVALRAARFGMDIDWMALWQRRLDIEHLEFEQALLRIDPTTGGWRIGGLVFGPMPGTDSAEPAQWGVGLQRIELRDLALQVQGPDVAMQMHIESAYLSRLATWNTDQSRARVELQGRIQDAPVAVKGMLTPFGSEPRATLEVSVRGLPLQQWRGRFGDAVAQLEGSLTAELNLDVSQQSDGLHLVPQGEWGIADLRIATAERQLSAGSLTWNGEAELVRSPTGMRLHDSGRYRLDVLRATRLRSEQSDAEALDIAADTLVWEGDMQWERRLRAGPAVRAEGVLSSGALRSELGDAGLALASAGGRWEGDLRYGMQDVPTGYEITGILELREARATTLDGDFLLAASDGLRLRGIDAKGTYLLAAEELALEGWRLLAPANTTAPAVLHGTGARIQPVALDGLRHFRAGDIHLQGVEGLLRREADGGWYLLDRARAVWPGSADAPPTGGLRIDRLQVSPGSLVHIQDRSVSPAYSSTLTLERLRIEELDRGQPHRPSPFLLQGRLDNRTPLRITGEVLPFTAAVDAAVKAQVESLDLATLSPYAADAFGYAIDGGQLIGTLDLRIISRQLRGEIDLLLRNLALDAAAADAPASIDQRLQMPVEKALAILRDKDGHISLEVPIRGDLEDPEFAIPQMLRQALAEAMRSTIVTSLKRGLQPFGAIVLGSDLTQEAAGAVRLEPVDFVAGSTRLSPVAQRYLERLSSVLTERPELRIRVCGIATPADRQWVAEGDQNTADALLALARTRSEAIRNALANQHGVDPDRLLPCQPQRNEGVPRVELLL